MPNIGGSISASTAKSSFRGLGIGHLNNNVVIYYYSPNNPSKISSAISENGIDFEKTETVLIILDENKKEISPEKILGFKIQSLPDGYLMDYQVIENSSVKYRLATSSFQGTWETLPDDAISKSYGKTISKPGFDVHFVTKTSEGTFVIYQEDSLVKAMCLDKDDPDKIIWQTKNALWQKPEIWGDNESKCLGCVFFQGRPLSYWDVDGLGLFLVTYPVFENEPAHEYRHLELEKHINNPILSPNRSNEWESEATFNAGAFYEDGKVYLIYRAVGRDYISVLGLAESTDGTNFNRSLEHPIYTGSEPFEIKHPEFSIENARKFISGGGYGGCEDPRITKIGDRIYMVYVAFNGYEPPRLALTSIAYENFVKGRFLWEKPVLISPPGVIDKSGCILPEKINGKYVIFHRIYPNILIDFVDNLEFDGTNFLKGEFSIAPRPNMWDSRKIGVGAPPIKTNDGWLLIYQGVGESDSSKYKVGAMLLDINNPTVVTHRTDHPILEPTENYENGMAKFGVIYPCGAVVIGDDLFVYYGGSDSVTCVAKANLKEFISNLKNDATTKMQQLDIGV